jgi:hypothetical protein
MQSVWLFQALYTYKLVEEIPAQLDKGDYWEISQNWKYMNRGDRAILWQAEPDAGIYAFAELAEKPYPSTESEAGWRVDIKYEPLLKQPIFKSDLIEHPILRDLLIIRMPHGRNPTLVSVDQWRALQELIPK